MLLELMRKILKKIDLVKPDYRIVSIYADPSENLYIIPNSEKPMRGVKGGAVAEMDEVNYLEFPYSDELLEKVLLISLEKCHAYIPEWKDGLTPMEKYLHVKRYDKTVIDKRVVFFRWYTNDGYCVIPTIKLKKGYEVQAELTINLGKTITKGNLATEVKQALFAARI